MLDPTRRLSKLDRILIGVVVALSVASVAGSELEDRAYSRWRAAHPVTMSKQPESRWPAWILDWRLPIQSRLQSAKAGLVTATLGLAFVAFWPGRSARPRRLGPGRVAIAVGGGLVVTSIGFLVKPFWIDPLVTGRWPISDPSRPAMYWMSLSSIVDPTVAWGILAGWVYLAISGHWRRPTDLLERAGRWLGWAWLIVYVATFLSWQIPFA